MPIRKIEYHTLPSLSDMKKAGIGPFFEELSLNLSAKLQSRVAKWTELMGRFAEDDFPLEAANCDPALRDKTQKRVLKGVPQQFRWEAWSSLRNLSYRINEENYEALERASSELEVLIQADACQTFPGEAFFQWEMGREMLFRVLSKFARKHEDVGYGFGMNFIAGFMLLVSGGREVEVFYMMEDVMESFGGMYTPGYPYLRQCTSIFLHLISKKLPQVSTALTQSSIPEASWVSSWFQTLFTAVTPLSVTTRIWDLLLVHGVVTLFQVGIALLRTMQVEIIGHSLSDISQCFRSLLYREFRTEELIRQVCKSKFRVKNLRHLENMYTKNPLLEESTLSSESLKRGDSQDSKEQSSSPSVSTHFFDSQQSISSLFSPEKQTSKVPSLPPIRRSYVEMGDFTAEDIEYQSESDGEKPVNARDVLEDMLQDPDCSVMSLESLSNLPRQKTPEVDKWIGFVDRLPY